ncbi:MAG: phenylalanine--tRNA ligase subunit beta [Chloroflexi bacterium 54-19]|nr:MAG: phenylalanine--tRNA ligase subunit beta [Chloroflexi bacterium 54-19]
MKVPLSWLRDYVNLTQSPEEIAAGLTLRGLEVAEIIRVGQDWDKVVVGQVEKIEKHPNADRLVVLQVTDGSATFQVVTGAFNLKEGDKIPLALPGAKLIDGHKLVDEQAAGKRNAPLLESGELPYFTVKAGKMRGVDSNAVAVAALELGISEDFDGIVVLNPEYPVGETLSGVLGDVILDIELSPNLGRALSMIGVAREVAAMTGQKIHWPEIYFREDGPPTTEKIKVTIEDPDLCPRYDMMVVEGVKLGPSPSWLQNRLSAAGVRPINNVVDVTNYVMLEIGQPLHAFDYDDIAGKEIIVRRARPGEKIQTIDHKEHELESDVLLIADADRGVAMAGVMGGVDSEVKDTTVNVALESANFDPANVRKTGRGLFSSVSEAAKRFERTVDIELAPIGVRRGVQLIQELAGGTISKGVIDVYPQPRSPHIIELPLSEIPRILGVTIPSAEVIRMLEALEFEIAELRNDGSYQFRNDPKQYTIIVSETTSNPDILMVRVPTYRNDVTIKADLVEEIARQYGYDKIPEARLQGELPPQVSNPPYEFEDKLREVLTSAGLFEIITYPLVSLESLRNLHAALGNTAPQTDPGGPHLHHLNWSDPAHLLTLANPLSSEHEVMRPTLLGTTLETIAENLHFVDRVAIFELGRVYLKKEGEPLPDERRTLSVAMTGRRVPLSRFNPKITETDRIDFFDLKGVLEHLLERLNLADTEIQFVPVAGGDHPALHPGRAVEIIAKGQGKNAASVRLGFLGEVHPKVAEAFQLDPLQRIAVAELDVELLRPLVQRERYEAVTRMPVVTQDLAIVVSDETPAGQVQKLIRETGGKLLKEVTLFDIYRGKQVGEGKKSLAFRLAFHPQEKNLTEEEVSKIRQRIEGRLVREVGAETRA